jgi:hypothetical protein
MNPKTILVSIIALAVLIGGGFVVYTQLNSSEVSETESTSEVSSESSSLERSESSESSDESASIDPIIESVDGDVSFNPPSSIQEKTTSDLHKQNVTPSACTYYGESDALVVVLYNEGTDCVTQGNFSGSESVTIGDFDLTQVSQSTRQGDMLYFDSYQANDTVTAGFLYKDIRADAVEADIIATLESIAQE